jgi:hypothetical protein
VSARKRVKGEIIVTASRGKGESCDARDVPSTPVVIPVHDNISTMQSIGLGFRMQMLSIGEEMTPERGSVATGTGLGSDAIQLEWRGRKAVVFGRDLFKAWVATFAPDDVARMP